MTNPTRSSRALLVAAALASVTGCNRGSSTTATPSAAAPSTAATPAPTAAVPSAAVPAPAPAPTAPTPAPAAAAGANALNTSGTPNYGVRPLAPGFTPDPVTVPVVSGGALDARALSVGDGCVGFVTSQPDFNIQLSAADTFLRLYVTSDEDTTLIVNDAAGHWHCNDDASGHNPMVDLRNTPAGLINVWVGSYHAGAQAHAQLHVTELESNHP